MGEASLKLAQANRKMDRPKKDDLNAQEKNALAKLRKEAKFHGATLESDGKGGLPPSLVLHIFRRDKWRCKRCGLKQDLTLHHVGGIPESKWLSKKGHSNDPNNIVLLCAECHDALHEGARDKGTDSSQVTPEGDVGTRRDKGLPVAKPDR